MPKGDAPEEAGIVAECRRNDKVIHVCEFGIGEVILQ